MTLSPPLLALLLAELLVPLGCVQAATKILDDSGDTGTAGSSPDGGASDGGASDGGASDGGASDGGGSDGGAADQDGDGWTEAGGDCDDLRADINPGAVDLCDALDNDCDGALDEDGTELDGTEPNDATAWYLGELTGSDRLQQLASLHNEEDVDRFRFSFEDSSFGLFTLRVSVANVPAGLSYRVRLEHLDRGAVVFDEAGSGTLSVEVGDTLLQDDGGTWELRVSSESGADCGSQYLVSVEL